MCNSRILAVFALILWSASAQADFQWTAANWSISTSIVIGGLTPNTGAGSATNGPTDENTLTANLSAYAGIYTGGGYSANSCVTTLTFSREFTITGSETLLDVRRVASVNVSTDPIGGNHYGTFYFSANPGNFQRQLQCPADRLQREFR